MPLPFWNKVELSQMHIELTNACNAACPMCVRFHNNSPLVRPDLTIGQITLEKFEKYFPPHIIKNCNLILFCGVHGDPCVAKDFLEICKYIQNCSSNTAVRVNTNGGMRNTRWWKEVGELFLKKFNGESYWQITFSIDGLEDTNHLYRRNVNWETLIENIKAYINAGGNANWDYLIFKHNEHQIDEARNLAKVLGFSDFTPKKALGVSSHNKLTPLAALNKEGSLDYIIEAPVNPKNRNLENPEGEERLRYYPFNVDTYNQLKKDKSSGKDFKTYCDTVYEDRILKENNLKYDNCSIKCKSNIKGKKEIFVDNFGRVLPCCYIGTHLNGVYTDTRTLQLHHHMNKYGWEHFSLEKHTLEEILDGEHLDRVFADSWDIDKVANGKLSYCADTCGSQSSIDRIFSHDDIENKKKYER